jgi:hypothetical protein
MPLIFLWSCLKSNHKLKNSINSLIMKFKSLIPILSLTLLFSCSIPQEKSTQSKVNTIIHNCRNVYGSNLIDENRITFQLRNYNYIWDYTDAGRLQQRATIDTLGNTITDIWIGDNFYRYRTFNLAHQ